ncbi:MAG: hypothetical protein ACI8XO_000838 [Verrucomicrobiales bacterium]|jgi:hypothetical protein
MTEPSKFQLLLKTGVRYLFDAVDLTLEEARIPHELKAVDVTGQRHPISGDCADCPGTLWSILVPSDQMTKAQGLIGELPWDFSGDCPENRLDQPARGKWFTAVIWVIAVVFVALIAAVLANEWLATR